MVLVLPQTENFASKLGQGLSQSISSGIQGYERARDIKRERQGQYGALGSQIFGDLVKDATPEEKANFYKMSADMAQRGESPQNMYKKLADLATNYKNKVSRIEENIEPERLSKKFTDIFTGESPESREKKGKLATKGLSELPISKRRELLQKKGLEAEEVENRISPLSNDIKQSISGFPDLRPTRSKQNASFDETPQFGVEKSELTEPQREYFQKHLAEIFQKHPDVNPLLLRKEFEEKGISWREYRDAIENLQESGQVDFSSNPEYAYLENYLQKPPLGPLRKILHGLGFVGR